MNSKTFPISTPHHCLASSAGCSRRTIPNALPSSRFLTSLRNRYSGSNSSRNHRRATVYFKMPKKSHLQLHQNETITTAITTTIQRMKSMRTLSMEQPRTMTMKQPLMERAARTLRCPQRTLADPKHRRSTTQLALRSKRCCGDCHLNNRRVGSNRHNCKHNSQYNNQRRDLAQPSNDQTATSQLVPAAATMKAAIPKATTTAIVTTTSPVTSAANET